MLTECATRVDMVGREAKWCNQAGPNGHLSQTQPGQECNMGTKKSHVYQENFKLSGKKVCHASTRVKNSSFQWQAHTSLSG